MPKDEAVRVCVRIRPLFGKELQDGRVRQVYSLITGKVRADETWEDIKKLINNAHSRAYNKQIKAALLAGKNKAKHFDIVLFYADIPWS